MKIEIKTYYVVETQMNGYIQYWNGTGLWTAANNPERNIWETDIHKALKFKTIQEAEELMGDDIIGDIREHMDIDLTTNPTEQ